MHLLAIFVQSRGPSAEKCFKGTASKTACTVFPKITHIKIPREAFCL